MENLNRTIFLLLNASAHPARPLLIIAILFAEYAIWVIPAAIGIGWCRGSESTRKVLLEATVSGLAGLLINQLIGLIWQHPRPFMIGLGHTLIAHAADSSFPSDHLSLLWAVAFGLLMHCHTRMAGLALTLLGLPVAWARIYLGVHFPLDMAGAAMVALVSSWLASRQVNRYLPAAYRLAFGIHRILFGKLIEAGWMRK